MKKQINLISKQEKEIFAQLKTAIELRLKELGKNKLWLSEQLNISNSRLSMILGNQTRGEVWKLMEIVKVGEVLNFSMVIDNGVVTFIPNYEAADRNQ